MGTRVREVFLKFCCKREDNEVSSNSLSISCMSYRFYYVLFLWFALHFWSYKGNNRKCFFVINFLLEVRTNNYHVACLFAFKSNKKRIENYGNFVGEGGGRTAVFFICFLFLFGCSISNMNGLERLFVILVDNMDKALVENEEKMHKNLSEIYCACTRGMLYFICKQVHWKWLDEFFF